MLDSKNILVVEDDSDIRELISFNLSNQGHQVFEANNGELGIEKARKKLPDLILLDLMLPGIHGLDVCRIFKADQETKDIPIIMVTAMGQEEDIVKGLETGADDYITKPIKPRALTSRINSFFKRRFSSKDSSLVQEIETLKIDKNSYTTILDGKKIYSAENLKVGLFK